MGDPSLIVRGSGGSARSNLQRAGVSIAKTGNFCALSPMCTIQLGNVFIPSPFSLVCPFQPPLTDLAVVLILTSNIGALKFRARALFDLWLKQGTFPFAQLELVLSLRRSNEVSLIPTSFQTLFFQSCSLNCVSQLIINYLGR